MHRVVKTICGFLSKHLRETGVVAVSGGADSVALLRGLVEGGGCKLIVAHVNHQIRGDESNSDEEFVRSLAESLGVEFRSIRIDVSKEGGNLEAVGRRERYSFFERIAEEAGASWIATGHTADDQAETVLHRLIRGTGLQGLRGIALGRASEREPTRRIVRPLLFATRDDVLDYLASLPQPFRTDRTNTDPRFTRNRIRAELVPLLKTFNPKLVSVLGRLARQAAEDYAYLEQQAEAVLSEAEKPRAGDSLILDRGRLYEAPNAVVREMLRLIWRREGWPMGEMDFNQWDRACWLQRHDFPGGIQMRVTERVVQLRRQS